MSIRGFRSDISASALQSQFDRGIGSGHGKDYKPPITTENFDSLGHSGKYHCPVSERTVHYLSETEEGARYGALQDQEVTDLRENYPLATGLTELICKQFRLRHPRSTGEDKPLIPFTVDLLVSRRTPPTRIVVLAKTRQALKEPKNRKEALVLHAYWSLFNTPIFWVTDLEFTKNILESLQFLRPQGHLARSPLDKPEAQRFLEAARQADWTPPLLEVIRTIANQIGMDSTPAMEIYKELVWSHALPCDYQLCIGPRTRNAVCWR